MIEIEGIEEIVRRLGVAQTIRLLRNPIWRGAGRIVNYMADYPPQPAGTRYVRGKGTANRAGVVTRFTSERLGQSWTQEVRETSDSIEGEVGNNASYGPFVQTEQFQAGWMGHWQNTDEAAVEEFEPVIGQDIEETLQGALNGTVS